MMEWVPPVRHGVGFARQHHDAVRHRQAVRNLYAAEDVIDRILFPSVEGKPVEIRRFGERHTIVRPSGVGKLMRAGIVQHGIQQPRGAQRPFNTASRHIYPAGRIPLEGPNPFRVLPLLQRLRRRDAAADQRIEPGRGNPAVFGQEEIEIAVRSQHKALKGIHKPLFGQKVKELSLIQKGNLIGAGIVQIFLFGILLPAAHKKRGTGGQHQVIDLQMILLCHNVTPRKTGFA
ncbi:MAG: hypothetical protein PUF76_09980 [bacterium]|nr:hypothetical protein [bacterium]